MVGMLKRAIVIGCLLAMLPVARADDQVFKPGDFANVDDEPLHRQTFLQRHPKIVSGTKFTITVLVPLALDVTIVVLYFL